MKEADRRKAKKVVEVDIAIGSLTFLNPEQIRFWYEMLTKDTTMEGSKLVIEESLGTVRCPKCGYEGNFKYIDDPAFHLSLPTLQCPKCDGLVEIISGKDCIIKSIKMLI
jgi:hydrogenase nickel incorporation protein HypA/HybF